MSLLIPCSRINQIPDPHSFMLIQLYAPLSPISSSSTTSQSSSLPARTISRLHIGAGRFSGGQPTFVECLAHTHLESYTGAMDVFWVCVQLCCEVADDLATDKSMIVDAASGSVVVGILLGSVEVFRRLVVFVDADTLAKVGIGAVESEDLLGIPDGFGTRVDGMGSALVKDLLDALGEQFVNGLDVAGVFRVRHNGVEVVAEILLGFEIAESDLALGILFELL